MNFAAFLSQIKPFVFLKKGYLGIRKGGKTATNQPSFWQPYEMAKAGKSRSVEFLKSKFLILGPTLATVLRHVAAKICELVFLGGGSVV